MSDVEFYCFFAIFQNSQDISGDDEHMCARLFFNLRLGEQEFKELYVDIKQVVGAVYSESLEVFTPRYKHNDQVLQADYNFDLLRTEAEAYYRKKFCISGNNGGGKIIMRNNGIIN